MNNFYFKINSEALGHFTFFAKENSHDLPPNQCSYGTRTQIIVLLFLDCKACALHSSSA